MTPAQPASLYLIGSCAAGTDGPSSDVDLVVFTETGEITDHTLQHLLWLGGVHRLLKGRPVDLLVIDEEQLRANLLLANCMQHGRLLVGPGVAIPVPVQLAWAVQAERYAFQIAARPDPEQHRSAVLWAAAARLVMAGAAVPALKGKVAAMWAERVGDRWTGLLQRLHAGHAVDPALCRSFLAEARVPPR